MAICYFMQENYRKSIDRATESIGMQKIIKACYELKDVELKLMIMERLIPNTIENEPCYEYEPVDVWDGCKHLVIETNYD